MKIIIVCPTRHDLDLATLSKASLGGIETASIELARSLIARGHQLVLATRSGGAPSHDGIQNIAVEHIGKHGCDVLISSNDARVFDQHQGDALKVLWLHNPLPLEKAIRRSQLGPLWRHRPAAVFVGSVAEEEMSRIYPFRSRTIIPHGISQAFLGDMAGTERQNDFVWASQKQRGLVQTLDVWRTQVARLMPSARFHVFGTHAHELEPPGMDNTVIFHGPVSKEALARFYATAKAMLYPGAPDETFCMAAAEAQSMGLPVITLGIGSLSERVQHGINGLVCRNHQEMGRQAVRLVHDQELWDLLHTGAVVVRQQLDWKRVAKLWEAFILSQGSHGSG